MRYPNKRTSIGLGGKVDHRSGMDSSGYYIRTNSGRKLYWDRLTEHDFDINDIAHSLAARVRWSGHVSRVNGRFISIGQHSCIVHDLVVKTNGCTPMRRKQALLHDGAEAYMPDFPSPLKWWMRSRGNDELFKLETRVDEAICAHFKVTFPWDKEIKDADLISLATENRDFMPDSSVERNFMPPPMRKRIVPWGVERTMREYLRRWEIADKGREFKG